MFLHYLKSSFRYMRRFALQNIISMAGLAAGFMVYAFSSLWTGYANSYDSYHKDADRIYTFTYNEDGRSVIGNERTRRNGDIFFHLFLEYSQNNMLDSLGIESFIRYNVEGGGDINNDGPTCLCIDSSFIEYFNPILLAGDWSFMDDMSKVAVSRSYAAKEYGDESPIGKTLTVKRSPYARERQYTIGAVMDDYEHSYIRFDMLRRLDSSSLYSYKWLIFKLKEGVTPKDMLARCEDPIQVMFSNTLENAMAGKKIIPLKEFYKNIADARESSFIKLDDLGMLTKASLLILICAIVNHFTFFLNYLRGRRREMSLRKVYGASNGNIAVQLLFESSIPVLISLIVSLILTVTLKKPYMRLADIDMTDSFYLKGSIGIMLAVLVVSVALSLIEILAINSRTIQSNIRHADDRAFRRISLGVQIASGVVLMFALAVMYRQFSFMRNNDWGTKRKNTAIVVFPQDAIYTENGNLFWGDLYLDELESKYGLKDRISALPFIEGVYMNFADMSIRHFGESALVSANMNLDDILFPDVYGYLYPELIDRLGLTVLDGAIPIDGIRDDEIVITENLLKALGGNSLEDMHVLYILLDQDPETGDRMNESVIMPFNVVAVIKDIHVVNYDDLPTQIILCSYRNKYLIDKHSYGTDRKGGSVYGELSVMYKSGSKKQFESAIKDIMGSLGIEYKIQYPNDDFFNHLSKDRNLTRMLLILCLISIFIALFGVFSQISLSCMERRREIAIRKTHGAKIREIISIFAREYGIIFLISSSLAFVLGYIVIHRWIQQFYYQAAISWWIYLSVFLFTALVIVGTVLNRVLKTARENPADVIKSE